MIDFAFNNLKQLIFPEEWLAIDRQVTKFELLTLILIDRHGQIIMSQMSDFLSVPMSTATGIMDRLVKKGLVQRTRDESDRRTVVITLTEEGQRLINQIKNRLSGYIRKISDVLTAEERQLLLGIITKIVSALQEKQPDTGEEPAAPLKKIDIK